MKQTLNTFHLLLSVAAVLLSGGAQAKVSVTALRTERMENPMSLTTTAPRFGWQIQSDKRDVRQTAYRIIVASTPDKAQQGEGDLWDATVTSDRSQWIAYGGLPLKADTRAWWRVRVETNKGKSDWSETAMFNIGLLTEADWRGRWIGMEHANAWDREDEHSRLSARYLRQTFDTGDKPVRRATLYICGLGLYEAYVNGRRVKRRRPDARAHRLPAHRPLQRLRRNGFAFFRSFPGGKTGDCRRSGQWPLLHHATTQETV